MPQLIYLAIRLRNALEEFLFKSSSVKSSIQLITIQMNPWNSKKQLIIIQAIASLRLCVNGRLAEYCLIMSLQIQQIIKNNL